MDIYIELYIIIFPVSLRIFHENIILRRELSYDCNLIYKSWGKLLTLENEGHLIPVGTVCLSSILSSSPGHIHQCRGDLMGKNMRISHCKKGHQGCCMNNSAWVCL